MLLRSLAIALSCLLLLDATPAKAEDDLGITGSWRCTDHHQFWKGQNINVDIFQIFMEGGKAVRVYSATFYEDGVKMEFVMTHDWSLADGKLTISNLEQHFSNGIEWQDFQRKSYRPMSNKIRQQVIQVINRLWPLPPDTFVNYDIRRTGQTIYFGENDRFECLRSESI